MVVFLFLVVALVIVVGAVTLAAVGGGDSSALPEASPEQWTNPPPWDRPLRQDDVEALRFPTAVRGYRMAEVDEALGRLGAELAERDARIAHLESLVQHAAAPAPAQPPAAPGGYLRPGEYQGPGLGGAPAPGGYPPIPHGEAPGELG